MAQTKLRVDGVFEGGGVKGIGLVGAAGQKENRLSAIEFIAFVITITASQLAKGVSSELQSPQSVSVQAEEPLRGSHVRERSCSLRAGERRPHD